MSVTKVIAYSEAYFALLRQLPDLAAYLEKGAEVLVAGKRISVQIGAAGTGSWKAGELDAVVRSFRGA